MIVVQTSVGTASWSDIEQLYKLEAAAGTTHLRLAPKLTLSHVFLTLCKTMSVKLAAQIFSQSVAAGK